MIGHQVGPYQILEIVGEGGMGTVYRGIDRTLQRAVAIKALRPEVARQPHLVERFRTEALTLARLNHPHIATLYNLLEADGQVFMVMEFVSGPTLQDVLDQPEALPLDHGLALVHQTLQGLEHAHGHDIVHRDLKPANIMLTEAGTAKIMDFGIARMLGSSRMTRTGHILGTLAYMAPEQIQGGEGDARSDLYALGALLFEIVTGHVPFSDDSEYALMKAQIEQPPPRPRTLVKSCPAPVEDLILRALEKDPNDRFPSAQAMREHLEAAVAITPLPPIQHPTRETAVPSAPTPLPPTAPPTGATRLADAVLAPATRLATMMTRAAPPIGLPSTTSRQYAGIIVGVFLATLIGLWAFGVFSGKASSPPSQNASVLSPSDNGIPTSKRVAQPRQTVPAPPPKPSQEPKVKLLEPVPPIQTWLTQARTHLEANQLTTPPGENAYELCQRVLDADPDNEAAQEIIRQIARRYATWGRSRLQRGDPKQALAYFEKSLVVWHDPTVAQQRDRAAATISESIAASSPASTDYSSFKQVMTVPASTPVRVRLTRTIDSSGNTFREGTNIAFEVLGNVIVSGQIVIRKGAPATGVVVAERTAYRIRRGELRFTLRAAEAVDGSMIPLRSGIFGREGERGQNVIIEGGAEYTAQVARSTPVGIQ